MKNNHKTLVSGRESMSSKERVQAFFCGEPTDRVPIDMAWNPGIRQKVVDYFGNEDLASALGVDFKGIDPRYQGPEVHIQMDLRQVNPEYGWRTKWVPNSSGGYWDFCDFPLENADVDEVLAWEFSDPDHYSFKHFDGYLKKNSEMGIYAGNPGMACIMNTAGFLRGMEQMFIDLVTDDEAGLLLIDKLMAHQLALAEKTLEAGKGQIDFLWMGEDLGTQIGPLIGMDIFRKHIRPRQQPFFDLANRFGIPTLLQNCGSSSWAYEEYIEMGLTGVDTLQPEAKNMSPRHLKESFDGRLVFHGCISSTGALSFGSANDVEEDCREVLETMMPGGGYAFSPTHCLQDNTPVENVVRMYETVHRVGWY
jgi:uroporphyrinogen decarboxylase